MAEPLPEPQAPEVLLLAVVCTVRRVGLAVAESHPLMPYPLAVMGVRALLNAEIPEHLAVPQVAVALAEHLAAAAATGRAKATAVVVVVQVSRQPLVTAATAASLAAVAAAVVQV